MITNKFFAIPENDKPVKSLSELDISYIDDFLGAVMNHFTSSEEDILNEEGELHFETYGEEYAFVKATYDENPRRVFAVSDGEHYPIIQSGINPDGAFNIFLYILTKNPLPEIYDVKEFNKLSIPYCTEYCTNELVSDPIV
jgi:hypothetical protein